MTAARSSRDINKKDHFSDSISLGLLLLLWTIHPWCNCTYRYLVNFLNKVNELKNAKRFSNIDLYDYWATFLLVILYFQNFAASHDKGFLFEPTGYWETIHVVFYFYQIFKLCTDHLL